MQHLATVKQNRIMKSPIKLIAFTVIVFTSLADVSFAAGQASKTTTVSPKGNAISSNLTPSQSLAQHNHATLPTRGVPGRQATQQRLQRRTVSTTTTTK